MKLEKQQSDIKKEKVKEIREEKEKKKPHSWKDKSLVVHIITYFVLLFGTFTGLYSIILYFTTLVIIE